MSRYACFCLWFISRDVRCTSQDAHKRWQLSGDVTGVMSPTNTYCLTHRPPFFWEKIEFTLQLASTYIAKRENKVVVFFFFPALASMHHWSWSIVVLTIYACRTFKSYHKLKCNWGYLQQPNKIYLIVRFYWRNQVFIILNNLMSSSRTCSSAQGRNLCIKKQLCYVQQNQSYRSRMNIDEQSSNCHFARGTDFQTAQATVGGQNTTNDSWLSTPYRQMVSKKVSHERRWIFKLLCHIVIVLSSFLLLT